MFFTKANRPALVLVDIQKGFGNIDYWGGERNNPDAEINAGELLHVWRENKLPVFHIQHCSSNPVSPLHAANAGNAFHDSVTPLPGEVIITKNVNSAFIGTNLQEVLERDRIKTLVIAGLTTDHCISTTTRMAGNLGFETLLVADATAAFNKKGVSGENFPAALIHETALASLQQEFATIVTTHFIKQNM